jgi:hypothetical protein
LPDPECDREWFYDESNSRGLVFSGGFFKVENNKNVDSGIAGVIE